jgi:hypothetical protein
LLLFVAGAAGLPQTNNKNGKPAQPAPKPESSPVPPQLRSDPTIPSDKLREATESNKPGASPRLPYVALRGRVLAKDKPPVALLELDPKLPPHAVTKGTTLMSGNVKLSVTEVTATEVRIEVSPLNETIVLR